MNPTLEQLVLSQDGKLNFFDNFNFHNSVWLEHFSPTVESGIEFCVTQIVGFSTRVPDNIDLSVHTLGLSITNQLLTVYHRLWL